MDSRTFDICQKVWYKIGHVGYDVRQSWNYCAVEQTKSGKQNYRVCQWLKKAGDCVKYLKEKYPVKYVQSSYGWIYFWIDDSAIVAEVDKAIADAEAKRIAELMAIDLTPYVPTKAVLDKLTGYFAKGSKVNVKAIKDETKILTYYYAAVMLDWKDLIRAISQEFSILGNWYDREDKTIEAIDLRVKADPSIAVSRSKASDKLLQFSRKIWTAVKDSQLDFDFKTVPTTSDECWKDAKNGCAWTIAYLLTVGDKSVRFSEVTNEGVDSPSFGFQLNPCGYLMSKGELESIVIGRLKLA